MPRYTDESKERVRDAIDMIDLVGSRTELRRAGADSYSGLCPFHDERTPSFSVTPSKKMYYCFGCQAAGDAFTFVRETEGVDFPRALELLADRYKVALELEEEDPRAAAGRMRRERLLELLERTCSYYERYLWESEEAARAREYLAARGLEEAILREFRVGYAPSAWDRVLLQSRRGGFSEEQLLEAGLVQRSRDQPGRVYDRFRTRITFPLCDTRGRVLGFGARAMREDDPAKYLNSMDSDIYHKGRHLFGENLARSAAAKSGEIVLCEGYTDVIAMHQAGVRNTVGVMGTALTEDHAAELGRLAPKVVLALDADGPGKEAMLKAAARIEARNGKLRPIELLVAPLPSGSDPAEVLQRDGAPALAAALASAIPFVRFRVERILATGDAATPQGRDRILSALGPVFAKIGLGAMREELEREVAARLMVSERVIENKLTRDPSTRDAGIEPAATELDDNDAERSEREFLDLCIALPERGAELLGELDLAATFSSPLTRAAAEHLREHLDQPGAEITDGALASILAQVVVRAATLEPVPAQLELAARHLELGRIDRSINAARAKGGAGIEALAHERSEVKAELDEWMLRSLEDTSPAPR
jgi:DNA primase